MPPRKRGTAISPPTKISPTVAVVHNHDRFHLRQQLCARLTEASRTHLDRYEPSLGVFLNHARRLRQTLCCSLQGMRTLDSSFGG